MKIYNYKFTEKRIVPIKGIHTPSLSLPGERLRSMLITEI